MRSRVREYAADDDVMRELRAALCRCGASSNKPFCDGSRRRAGFKVD